MYSKLLLFGLTCAKQDGEDRSEGALFLFFRGLGKYFVYL